MIVAERQKQEERKKHFLIEVSATKARLEEGLMIDKRMRTDEFIKWLKKYTEEMDAVGRGIEDYDDVDLR